MGDQGNHDVTETKSCNEIHKRWYDDYLKPKIMIMLGGMLGVMLSSGIGGFFYISKNSIRDYDLQAREIYTTARQHERDLGRIEQRIERLESSVTVSLDQLGAKLDRNFDLIKTRSK